MAQMYNVGVFTRGENMVWTCRWTEGTKESSIGFEFVKGFEGEDSIGVRLRYNILQDSFGEGKSLDYNVSIRTSPSYKQKTWYWYLCPLIINGTNCHRRVRNLYFLPGSDYFGCSHCRDLVMRSLPLHARNLFRQTLYVDEKSEGEGPGKEDEAKASASGWKPEEKRQVCLVCGCFSEGAFCCNCGRRLDGKPETDFMKILGVGASASMDDIRLAFKMRLKEYHPDRVAHLGPKLQEVAEQEIKEINQAYAVLKDPQRREEYLRQVLGTR